METRLKRVKLESPALLGCHIILENHELCSGDVEPGLVGEQLILRQENRNELVIYFGW